LTSIRYIWPISAIGPISPMQCFYRLARHIRSAVATNTTGRRTSSPLATNMGRQFLLI